MPLYDYRIASGYGVALASLTNLETIADSDGKKFKAPYAIASYDPGVFRIRGDGTIYTAGYGTLVWLLPVVTRKQVVKLQTDYCAGGYSGKVTVYSRTVSDSYARYNAVLHLPKLSDSQRRMKYIENYAARLTRMVAL